MKTTKPEEWKFIKRFSHIRDNGLIEAICAHGIGHHKGIHGCDGCCANWPKEVSDRVTKDE
jgi:hypothetical protein